MHQAQPKEGHKIWLTQEADAKSWSGLKHVQPKEGRKELAPREIKFRYCRLDKHFLLTDLKHNIRQQSYRA